MMGKTAFALCYARPTRVLVAILGICFCWVLLSVYYVHSVHLSTSPDIIIRTAVEWKQRALIIADDSDRKSVLSGDKVIHGVLGVPDEKKLDDGTKSVESLNNIDIAAAIEEKKEEHQDLKRPNNVNKEYPAKLVKENARNKSPRKMTKEDKWPTYNKDQKKIHKIYHSSNPLYENPVRTRQNWNGEKYIVYLCHSNQSCAGWGDRQHGIFSVYLIALVTNRTFKVEFNSPCPLSKLYHPRIANWKVENGEFDGLSSTHLYAVNDREFRTFMKVIDFNSYFPQDVIYLTTNYDYYYSLKANPIYRDVFNKKVRNRPRPIIFADLWQNIFKMNKRVVRRFTLALKKAWPTEKHKLVCAHIRFGRNPSIPNDGDIRNTLSSIKPFWEFVKKYSDPNKYRLFVASDWEGFRTKVNEFYKDIAIKVDGKIMHIDKVSSVQGGDYSYNQSSAAESESLCDGLEMVIADQHVLSKCDILLLTYSVFGKSAAYLRRSNKDLYLMDKGKVNSLMLFNERYNTKH